MFTCVAPLCWEWWCGWVGWATLAEGAEAGQEVRSKQGRLMLRQASTPWRWSWIKWRAGEHMMKWVCRRARGTPQTFFFWKCVYPHFTHFENVYVHILNMKMCTYTFWNLYGTNRNVLHFSQAPAVHIFKNENVYLHLNKLEHVYLHLFKIENMYLRLNENVYQAKANRAQETTSKESNLEEPTNPGQSWPLQNLCWSCHIIRLASLVDEGGASKSREWRGGMPRRDGGHKRVYV